MSEPSYVVGVDYGSESARALLVDCADGRELASAVYPYSHGVIDHELPDGGPRLEPDWALQDPADYVRALQETVPRVLEQSGVDASRVIGVAIDFTSCTMLPVTADGTPLCELPELRAEPHAWVKLWKHHAGQPEADQINEVAEARGEPWLPRYGGKYSSEWFFSKALQVLHEAPDLYERTARFVDAGDWVVWQLTGVETRSACTAGYKAIWSKRDGYPSPEFFGALEERFAGVVDEKLTPEISPLGARAGGLSAEAARWTGLPAGIAVAIANVDAHVSVPGAGVTDAGTMVIIMGTSNCHLVLGERPAVVEGMCGVVEDGVLPGLHGFEAGQSSVGDIFAWFAENAVPPRYHEEARRQGVGLQELLEREAARLRPGESGLLALDWWNGNRSVLVDAELSGLIVGLTLSTRAPEIYRALIEATAFGTRVIVESFEGAGVAIEAIMACGGLPEKNELLMQIYADACGREIAVASSSQTPALGSAMHAAVAAGYYPSIYEAARAMARPARRSYRPDPASAAVYEQLYAEYVRLHDQLGRHGNDVMRVLRRIQHQADVPAVPA